MVEVDSIIRGVALDLVMVGFSLIAFLLEYVLILNFNEEEQRR